MYLLSVQHLFKINTIFYEIDNIIVKMSFFSNFSYLTKGFEGYGRFL